MRTTSRYKKFLIKDGDHFDELNFPQIDGDLDAIRAGTAHLPANFKCEMIISFIKNGFVKTEWIESNPLLAEFVNSKNLTIDSLEGLFDSCSENEVFRSELEAYVRKTLG